MHTGVASSWIVWQIGYERYTRLLMEARPEFPIHFLKIYSFCSSGLCGPVGLLLNARARSRRDGSTRCMVHLRLTRLADLPHPKPAEAGPPPRVLPPSVGRRPG